MTKASPFLWPKKSRIAFYNGRGKRLWDSTDRKLDLADSLMHSWEKASRTIYFGVSITADQRSRWDEKNISTIERHIRYGLGFDGYRVAIKRLSTNQRARCSEEFLWKLVIRSA